MRRQIICFSQSAVYHIYQNTHNGFLLFYSVRDYIVFYSIVAAEKEKYAVVILGLCLMPDHIHLLIKADSSATLSDFVKSYTSKYSKSLNKTLHSRGTLFNRPFGRAAKNGAKKIRTAISYLYNNPVERHLSKRAEDYRWNFLAYANCDHPFSERIPLRNASKSLRRAIKEVDYSWAKRIPLNDEMLDRLFANLEKAEKEHLLDHIISSYKCVTYKETISYYGTYAQMIIAINSNTGSEYDIREENEKGSDKTYNRMSNYLLSKCKMNDVKDVFALDMESRKELAEQLRRYTGATDRQIFKYLRLSERGG